MRTKSYSLFLFITSLLSLAVQSLQDAPKLETKYYIELPETFISTLEKNQHGSANLWHPRLTLTKVHSPKTETNLVTLGSKSEKLKKATPGFLSFLQVSQADQSSQGLTFIPGKQGNGTAFKSSKMDCECRFVKDPNSISLIMQAQGDSLQSEDQQSSGTTSTLIEKQDQENKREEDLSEKNNVKFDELVEIQSNLNEKSEETKEKDETEKLLELLEEKKKMKKELEDDDLLQLLEEKNRLKKQLEKEALLKELKEQKETEDLNKKLKDLEQAILVQKLQAELKEKESTRLKEEILAEIALKEPRHKEHLRDELLSLLDSSDSKGKYDDSDDDFESFYQKYKTYKSLLSVQNQKYKNRAHYDRYEDDEDLLQEYKLLQKVKSINNKSLKDELIRALL